MQTRCARRLKRLLTEPFKNTNSKWNKVGVHDYETDVVGSRFFNIFWEGQEEELHAKFKQFLKDHFKLWKFELQYLGEYWLFEIQSDNGEVLGYGYHRMDDKNYCIHGNYYSGLSLEETLERISRNHGQQINLQQIR